MIFGTATTEGAIIAAGMALSFFNLGRLGSPVRSDPRDLSHLPAGTGAGWAAGVGRIASIVAPLSVPVLLLAGGAPLLFAVFGVCFLGAAAAAWGLVDRGGQALDDR